MFKFVFQLYNFVSLANEATQTLCDPVHAVAELNLEVKNMGLKSLTSKRKADEDDDGAGKGSSSKRKKTGGAVEGDILVDVAILEALARAGYTILPEVENFTSLLPVRVSFA